MKKDKMAIETMYRVVHSDNEYAQCEYLSLQIECFVERTWKLYFYQNNKLLLQRNVSQIYIE